MDFHTRRFSAHLLRTATLLGLLAIGCVARATTYYISPSGSNSSSGNSANPLRTVQEGLNRALAGDTVIVRDGTYTESLDTVRNGSSEAARIEIRAENPRGAIVTHSGGRVLDVDHRYVTFDGLVFDGQFGSKDVISVDVTGDYLNVRNVEVRNGQRDGIDMGTFDSSGLPGNLLHGVTVQDSLLHGFLWFNGARQDAHAIVAGGVRDLTIRNTEAYYVSGDTLQIADGGWDNVLVDSVTFWNGPLPTDMGGFTAGTNPGENAIDTKQDRDIPVRGNLTVTDSVFYGWSSDLIGVPSALNIKEQVTAVLEGNTLFDNEVAMRLRGPGSELNAEVTAKNNVFWSNERAIRYEDDIENLHVYNNTFGSDNAGFFQSAGGYGTDFQVLNNLFLAGSKPSQASSASNLAVGASSFLDSANDDYRLSPVSAAIDVALALGEVDRDLAGNARPSGPGYDVGAFELVYGDANLDGLVSITDFHTLRDNFGLSVGWTSGNFNNNGVVDLGDLTIQRDHFLSVGDQAALAEMDQWLINNRDPQIRAYAAQLGLAIAMPEPSAVGLALSAGLFMLFFKRRPHRRRS